VQGKAGKTKLSYPYPETSLDGMEKGHGLGGKENLWKQESEISAALFAGNDQIGCDGGEVNGFWDPRPDES